MKAIAEGMNVLMIGNNPLELNKVFDCLKRLSEKRVITEFAFDLKSGLSKLKKFHPNFILLDDNLGRQELTHAIGSLAHSHKTKNIPITVLKNSNYHEAFGGAAMNYVLKENLSGDLLEAAFKSSLVSSRAQVYLKRVYQKRKGQIKRLLPGPKFH